MSVQKNAAKGLTFSRQFTKEGVSPYDMFEYDYRTSVIKNPSGEIVFQMDNVEVPKQWSQIATDIILNQRHLVSLEQLHKLSFFLIRQNVSQRVMAIGHRYVTRNTMTLERLLQNIEVHTGAAVRRNFDGFHAEGFNGLKDIEIRGGLRSDYIPGLPDCAQRQIQRLHCAAGNGHVIRQEVASRHNRSFRNLLSQ